MLSPATELQQTNRTHLAKWCSTVSLSRAIYGVIFAMRLMRIFWLVLDPMGIQNIADSRQVLITELECSEI